MNVIAVEADGRVLIGGDFTKVNGVTRPGLARLWGVEPSVGQPEPGHHHGRAGLRSHPAQRAAVLQLAALPAAAVLRRTHFGHGLPGVHQQLA